MSVIEASARVDVAALLAARREHVACAPPSASRPLGMAEAYAVQDRVRDALVASGERVVGWKAGFTSRAAQAAFRCDEPVCAFLLGSGVLASRAEVPVSRFVALVVEAEVALVMGRDLAGPGVTAAAALRAVDGALPALELVDFRYSGSPTGTDVVADGVYASAIVLGAPVTPLAGIDLALEGLVYELNGAIAATNTAAEVMAARSTRWRGSPTASARAASGCGRATS